MSSSSLSPLSDRSKRRTSHATRRSATGPNGGKKKKKWPAFMDASASVSVSIFGARRMEELAQLYAHRMSSQPQQQQQQQLQPQDTSPFQSGGGKTSSRHLRRRTTSHKTRRHWHRFPVGWSKSSPNPTEPPREDTTTDELPGIMSRKAKRGRPFTLSKGHLDWQHDVNPSVSSRSQIGTNCSDDQEEQPKSDKTNAAATPVATLVVGAAASHWMATHIWHAKRFHMEALWGWRIPVMHTNRGARAALRLSTSGYCTLQDLTWERGQALEVVATGSLEELVGSLSRLCPGLGDASNITKKEECLGEGMLHHLDQFPMEAIGPTWWHMIPPSTNISRDETWVVRLMVHPSIRSTVQECLKTLVAARPATLGWSSSPADDQCCCFRLCGPSATQILQQTLCLSTPPSTTPTRSTEHLLMENAPHALAINLYVHLPEALTESPPDDDVDNRMVRLVRQAPRSLTCPSNRAVSGWDVYCTPRMAHGIWMALVLHGRCVPIGIVEQSHLQLECEPPLPAFPRDYIDTEQGKRYWDTTRPRPRPATTCTVPSTRSNVPDAADSSWKTVRTFYEGGWGRLPKHQEIPTPPVIEWNHLVVENSGACEELLTDGLVAPERNKDNIMEEETANVVVVRSTFGQPFRNALEGCGRLPESTGSNSPKRRKRRRTTALNGVTYAEPWATERAEEWRHMIETLLHSLSLPAVLQAHIRLIKDGTVNPGVKVFVDRDFVGYATAGSFSPSRGVCHGFVALGSTKMLRALSRSRSKCLGRVVRLSDGSRQIQVACTLNDVDGATATICLVL